MPDYFAGMMSRSMFATKYNHRTLLRVYERTAKAGTANTCKDLHQEAALAGIWCDEVNHLAQSLFLLFEEKLDADQHQQPRVEIVTARMSANVTDGNTHRSALTGRYSIRYGPLVQTSSVCALKPGH